MVRHIKIHRWANTLVETQADRHMDRETGRQTDR